MWLMIPETFNNSFDKAFQVFVVAPDIFQPTLDIQAGGI